MNQGAAAEVKSEGIGNPFPQWGPMVSIFDSLPKELQQKWGRHIEQAACQKGAVDLVLRLRGIGEVMGLKHPVAIRDKVNMDGFPVLRAERWGWLSGGAQVASPLCHLVAWMRVYMPARILTLGL